MNLALEGYHKRMHRQLCPKDSVRLDARCICGNYTERVQFPNGRKRVTLMRVKFPKQDGVQRAI